MTDSPKFAATRHTEERLCIRQLVDLRPNGWSLLRSFFVGLTVTVERPGPDGKMVAFEAASPITIEEADLMNIYVGQPVEDEKWALIKRVLKERMTR